MNEENSLRIGAAYGEDTCIVGREGIAAIDANGAAIETVADVEGSKVHRGAAVGGDVDLLGRNDFSIDDERDGLRRGGGGEAGDHGLTWERRDP